MSHILSDLKAFLDASHTPWHAVNEMGNRLALCDFHPLDEEESWSLKPGQSYFVARGGALCAFCLPKKKAQKALLLASHTDSPGLKLKPCPTFQTENYLQLNTEVYGAPLLSSWLNRDLVLAGRVIVTLEDGSQAEKLIHLDDAIAFIPQLAIHLDKEVNDKGLVLNKQEHLHPILGLLDSTTTPKAAFETLLRRHLSFRTLLAFELFLVPSEPARFIGWNNELLTSYHLDNLISAHAALTALGSSREAGEHRIQMALFLDHEEIGSASREGADSILLNDLLGRIGYHLSLNLEEQMVLKNRSLCLSIDVAHALNPNYPQKQDPHHIPLLGKGIVLKQNANQKYASSAPACAQIVQACQELNLPCQQYASRSDLPSGSTVGPLIASQTGITTVDIGCPQLSMHSAREAVATKDYLDLVHLLTHLLQKE